MDENLRIELEFTRRRQDRIIMVLSDIISHMNGLIQKQGMTSRDIEYVKNAVRSLHQGLLSIQETSRGQEQPATPPQNDIDELFAAHEKKEQDEPDQNSPEHMKKEIEYLQGQVNRLAKRTNLPDEDV